MVALCHPDHPLEGRPRLAVADLKGEAFVDFHTDRGTRTVTDLL